jgi:protocatechuate 3,4-dioxygenase beta subunit
LTHDDWRKGLELLYQAGEISSPESNEFVLFSGVLGLSSLADMGNSPDNVAPSSVFGPFHVRGVSDLAAGGDMKGYNERVYTVYRRILSTDDTPMAGAVLEIWQTAENGIYSVQDKSQPACIYSCITTDSDGRYLFSTLHPLPYTVPDDGPVGELLRATGRNP